MRYKWHHNNANVVITAHIPITPINKLRRRRIPSDWTGLGNPSSVPSVPREKVHHGIREYFLLMKSQRFLIFTSFLLDIRRIKQMV